MPFSVRQTPYQERADASREPLPLIPAGWYLAAVDRAEYKQKNGKSVVSLSFRIMGGDFDNRLVFDDCYVHTDGCRRISLEKIHNLVDDIGWTWTGSDDELLGDIESIIGQEVDVKVYVKKGTGDYPDRNAVYATSAAGTRTGGRSGSADSRVPPPTPSPAPAERYVDMTGGGLEEPPF